MSDFDQLERDLSKRLREVAAAARPPKDAWERFAHRLEPAGSAIEQPQASEPGPNRINDRQRSHGVEITMRSNDVSPSRRRHWPLLGVAAGLIAVTIVGVALAARDTDEPAPPVATAAPPPPTTSPAPPSIELRGADGTSGAVEAFATVSAAFEAFNTGDVVGWVIPVRADGSSQPPLDEDDLEYTRARHAAGASFENGSCNYEDLAADPPPTTPDAVSPAARHQFECSATYVDAFTIAAGIDAVEEYAFLVADDGTAVETYNSGPDIQLRVFMSAFGGWLASEHPDIATLSPAYPIAADIPEALSLLDEFVAVDDRWPLTSE